MLVYVIDVVVIDVVVIDVLLVVIEFLLVVQVFASLKPSLHYQYLTQGYLGGRFYLIGPLLLS